METYHYHQKVQHDSNLPTPESPHLAEAVEAAKALLEGDSTGSGPWVVRVSSARSEDPNEPGHVNISISELTPQQAFEASPKPWRPDPSADPDYKPEEE